MNVNLKETPDDENQSAVPRNQSVRDICNLSSIVIDEHSFYLAEVTTKFANQNAAREDVNREGGERKNKRFRNLTQKGLA